MVKRGIRTVTGKFGDRGNGDGMGRGMVQWVGGFGVGMGDECLGVLMKVWCSLLRESITNRHICFSFVSFHFLFGLSLVCDIHDGLHFTEI